MERWIGKIAVVTGASSGIGAATAVDLANAGMTVIGLARRKERVEELSSQVLSTNKGKIVAYKCDVSVEEEVKNAFSWIENNYGGVDVLVNNAGKGTGKFTYLTEENNSEALRSVLDLNVMGLVICTREAFQSMKKRNVDGHIVHINSVAGHYIPNVGIPMNIYPASKYAVTALTEVYRQEFNMLKTKIKVTSISPGLVETEILSAEIKKIIKENEMPMLDSKDIAAAVLYAVGTPPHVQVHELTIMPVGQKL